MEECLWRNFLGGFSCKKSFGRNFLGGIFLGGIFWEELFGRNSLFTLLKLFHYERDCYVCQDFGFCQNFVSRQKKDGRTRIQILRSEEASSSHLKKVNLPFLYTSMKKNLKKRLIFDIISRMNSVWNIRLFICCHRFETLLNIWPRYNIRKCLVFWSLCNDNKITSKIWKCLVF